MTSKAVLVSNPLLTLDNTTTTQLRFPSESPPPQNIPGPWEHESKTRFPSFGFFGAFWKDFQAHSIFCTKSVRLEAHLRNPAAIKSSHRACRKLQVLVFVAWWVSGTSGNTFLPLRRAAFAEFRWVQEAKYTGLASQQVHLVHSASEHQMQPHQHQMRPFK